MKKNYVIACNKPWFNDLIVQLRNKTDSNFRLIRNKESLDYNYLSKLSPKYIFFPHWSFIIPEKIYKTFKCVIFHMTDVPFGRGGSPLQNLIVRGYTDTVISAIKCVKKIDSGPIYLKKPLNINGSAEEIYLRANEIIKNMILYIIQNNPKPIAQRGSIVTFERRKPHQGSWKNARDLDEVYNFIRMLDADGYPSSFIKIGKFKLEFSRVSKKVGALFSDVKITLEANNE